MLSLIIILEEQEAVKMQSNTKMVVRSYSEYLRTFFPHNRRSNSSRAIDEKSYGTELATQSLKNLSPIEVLLPKQR